VSDIKIWQMPAFKKAYKKLPSTHILVVDEAIRAIVNNPSIGEEKKGDLSGVSVYKFKINHQQMLLAYEWDYENRILLALGVHENFYRDLKGKQ
jgi:mRNA-degrading endonuclease RelE of RelBE toxin-antitoxin system